MPKRYRKRKDKRIEETMQIDQGNNLSILRFQGSLHWKIRHKEVLGFTDACSDES